MRRLIVCLCILLGIFAPKSQMSREISPMEALDLVKEHYAANFDKIYKNNLMEEYYYQLPQAELYLVNEGTDYKNQSYVIHLYEFVLDEADTGTGHFVTYGWYSVDKESGEVTEQTQ